MWDNYTLFLFSSQKNCRFMVLRRFFLIFKMFILSFAESGNPFNNAVLQLINLNFKMKTKIKTIQNPILYVKKTEYELS